MAAISPIGLGVRPPINGVHGCLAHEKASRPRTLQLGNLMAVLGGGGRSYARGAPASRVCNLPFPGAPALQYTTRWTSRVSKLHKIEGYVAKFAPHKALKWIAWRQVDF